MDPADGDRIREHDRKIAQLGQSLDDHRREAHARYARLDEALARVDARLDATVIELKEWGAEHRAHGRLWARLVNYLLLMMGSAAGYVIYHAHEFVDWFDILRVHR